MPGAATVQGVAVGTPKEGRNRRTCHRKGIAAGGLAVDTTSTACQLSGNFAEGSSASGSAVVVVAAPAKSTVADPGVAVNEPEVVVVVVDAVELVKIHFGAAAYLMGSQTAS